MYMSSSRAGIIFDSMRTPLLKKVISGIETDGIPLNELELIRLVYVRLGKYLSFNSKYRYLMSAQAQFKEESDAWKAAENAGFGRITSTAICIDVESLFSTILTEMYEIPSEIIVDGSGPHVYLAIKTSDYGKIYCDLQQDLYNIQLNRKTEYFASIDFYNGRHYSKVTESELYLIDRKIQYVTDDKPYSNRVFEEKLSTALRDVTDPVDTATAFFDTMQEVYGSEIYKMGYCEASESYKLLAKKYVPELQMIHRTLRTTMYNLISYFSMLDFHGQTHYFLADATRRYHIEVDAETIERLENTNRIVHKAILERK